MRCTVFGVTCTASPGCISRPTSLPSTSISNSSLPDQQEDRLVLEVVVLQAQGVALVDVDDLAHVAIGLRPVELVAPGLLDSRRPRSLARPFAHDSRAADPCARRLDAWRRPSARAAASHVVGRSRAQRAARGIARPDALSSAARPRLTIGIAAGVMLNDRKPKPDEQRHEQRIGRHLAAHRQVALRARGPRSQSPAAAAGRPARAARSAPPAARPCDRSPACTESDRSCRR